MRINPILYGVFVLTLFFGVIGGFQAAGVWSISGKVDASGAAIAPSADNIDTIKGWMTLEQVTAAFDLPLNELLAQFGLPADTPASMALKDLESDSFDITVLKDWLQSRGQPETLQPTGTPAVESEATPAATPAPPAEAAATAIPTEHAAPDRTITGKTTFQEVLDWGVPIETIQRVIGGELPAPSTVIKDYVVGQGLEFTGVKSGLQAEVDKTN